MSKRAAVAGFLDRVGVLRAVLEARARAWLPWRFLTVVTFHRVVPVDAPGYDLDVIDATPERFERQVRFLQRYFTLVDTRDLDAHRAGVALPANPAMITFDDGYRDNAQVALPILRRLGAKAVFFVATWYVDERRVYWWERIGRVLGATARSRLALSYPDEQALDLTSATARRRAHSALLDTVKSRRGLDVDRFLDELEREAGMPLPRDHERALAERLVMSWDDVRALRTSGMDVQSHTHRHRVLETLDPGAAEADLREARRLLEERIEAPVHALAYPSGRPPERPDLREAVRRAGYRLGLTSGPGLARLGGDVDWFEVPRVAVDRQMPEPFFRGCLAIPALAP
jgi:peptidoglycan/xylan/chitin deacetylase (PgdA/CDA1 family)